MQLSELKNLLKTYNLRPTKGKGQNFLIKEDVLAKIVAAADLQKTDRVLEIGPGFGVLTEQLIKKCHKVVGVELDKNLLLYLKQKFATAKNLVIVEGDILQIKNSDLAATLGAEKYKIVANLPYAITKPIIRKFLTYQPKPQVMVILVQKEVAQKIVAQENKTGLLSLSVLFYGQPEIIGYVAKENFFPEPAVESAILKITVRSDLPAEVSAVLGVEGSKNFSEKKFWQLIKIGFSSPRKQLQNNLAAGYQMEKKKVEVLLNLAGFVKSVRPENLGLKDWLLIYQQFVV